MFILSVSLSIHPLVSWSVGNDYILEQKGLAVASIVRDVVEIIPPNDHNAR